MDFISIFFILMSLIVVVYLFIISKSKERVSILAELFFIGIYLFVVLIFIYPNILRIIENILGVQSAINFIIYSSIFLIYFLVFGLYRMKERQRVEVTKLVREIAYLKKDIELLKKKKNGKKER